MAFSSFSSAFFTPGGRGVRGCSQVGRARRQDTLSVVLWTKCVFKHPPMANTSTPDSLRLRAAGMTSSWDFPSVTSTTTLGTPGLEPDWGLKLFSWMKVKARPGWRRRAVGGGGFGIRRKKGEEIEGMYEIEKEEEEDEDEEGGRKVTGIEAQLGREEVAAFLSCIECWLWFL